MSYNVSSVNLFSACVDKWLNLVYNLDTNGILYKWRYDMTIIPMREKTLSKIYEANLLNEGLTDLQNGKVVDGEAVRERIAKKYGG